MSLLSRNLRFAASILLLFVLSTLPLSGSTTHRGEIFPATAWAGGSPDETLNPQTPPLRAQSFEVDAAGSGETSVSFRAARPTSSAVLSWKERIGIALQILRGIYLTSMLRF